MEKFDSKILIPKLGQLEGEISNNLRFNRPLSLLWRILIPLEDFKILKFPIYDSAIELGSFTLPFNSLFEFDSEKVILKSWKELSNKSFDFTDSFVENIGSIYYYIRNKDIGEYWKDNPEYYEAKEFFDNIIDIHKIEFGEVEQGKIKVKLRLKIHFDSFNMHNPPFDEDIYGEEFNLEAELELKGVSLHNTQSNINSMAEAIEITKQAINISDYEPKYAKYIKKNVPANLTQSEERIFYIFEPILSREL